MSVATVKFTIIPQGYQMSKIPLFYQMTNISLRIFFSWDSYRIYSLTDKEHENSELNWAAYWVQADTGLELLATGWPRCQVLDKGCISQARSMGHRLQAQRDVPSGEFQN